MEAPSFSYMYPGGSLSPSLWDEDDWKKTPDALNNTLGSPQSPIFTNDGGFLPHDDDLAWMEKSCNLESITELYDLSVQDVVEIPMENKPVEMPPSFKQKTYETGEHVLSDDLFQVDGVEDLFHDYIDSNVYTAKGERKVSIDSCVSNGEDIENSFFSSTLGQAEKDINIFDYNEKQGWADQHVTKPQEPLPVVPLVSAKGFVSPTRPILPKSQSLKISESSQAYHKAEAPKVFTVVPVSTQKSVVIKPLIVNAKPINIKLNQSHLPIKLGQVTKEVVLAKKKSPVIVRAATSEQNGSLKIESTHKLKNATMGFSTAAKAVSAREASIDNFLSALRKEENLTPLQALLQESNNAKIEQPFPLPQRQVVFHRPSLVTELSRPAQFLDGVKEPIISSPSSPSNAKIEQPFPFSQSQEVLHRPSLVTELSRPAQFIDDVKEPIISSPSSPPKQSVEVITYESIMGSPNTDQIESPVQLEDILTCDQSGLDTDVEMFDFNESTHENEYLSPCSDYYLENGPGSSSSPSLIPCSTKPYSRYPRKATGRRRSLPVEEKKNRKKVQNKEAAIRYRQKKRDEYDQFVREENELYEQNKKLESQKDGIVTEIKYLKGLLKDLYKAKGLI